MGNCCTWKSDLEGVGEMQMRSQPYTFDSIPRLLNHERSSNMFKISAFLTNKENIPDYFLKQEIFYKNINEVILNSNKKYGSLLFMEKRSRNGWRNTNESTIYSL